MTPFEFISVFFSIVFGLALTHLLTGVANAVHEKRLGLARLFLSAFWALAVILNWWVAYGWRNHTAWTFDFFLLLVVWTVSFFGGAIALFPPKEESEADADAAFRNFMRILIVVAVLDACVTGLRSGLFSPWYYLLVQGYYVALAVAALLVRNGTFQRFVSVLLFASLLVWSLVVRRYLA